MKASWIVLSFGAINFLAPSPSITAQTDSGIEAVPAVSAQQPAGTNSPQSAADAPLGDNWQRRSTFLRGRIYHSALWTYSGMIVWGGGSEHQFYNDGGIYHPET